MSLKQWILVFTIILSSNYRSFSYGDIFDNKDLKFFIENNDKVVFKKENMDSSNQIKNKIYTSGISVKEVTNLKKNELKYFPKNLIVNCKNIEKAIIYVNEDILLKIKNEFDINSKVVFKKSTNSLYEIPFYFSENEECVFNKGKYSNVDLKNNVMSAVKNYLKLNGRQ